VAAVADGQHGVISRCQLRRLGFKNGAINHAVASGRLHRVFRGVYALGHGHIAERAQLMAAIDPRRRGMKMLLGLIDEWRGAAPLLGKRGRLKSPLEAKVLPLLVRRDLERDRWRDRELMRAGYSCLRVTSRQAEREAGAIADTVAAGLAPSRSATSSPAAKPPSGGNPSSS
jgi:Transcriptional regulator, AbiEi antitoxin